MVVGAVPSRVVHLPAILILPALVAFVLATLNFRKRVGGVYFSIITLALAAIMAIVIIGQQGVTGGVNGITDFKTFLGMDLDTDRRSASCTSSPARCCSSAWPSARSS